MNEFSILKGKWFYACQWDLQTEEQNKVNSIIKKLIGFPLQILDFMLDWFYRDLKKFPVCVAVCNAFEWKPCAVFKLENPWFIYNNLCIDYSDFMDAVDLLEQYDLIKYREYENYCGKVYFNLEKIIYLLYPAQTKDSKIFIEILQKYVDIYKELEFEKLEKQYKQNEILGRCFPSIEYFNEHPLNLQSYD